MSWDSFASGFFTGIALVWGIATVLFIVIDNPDQKYINYTEHACVTLRMTHACKVLTEEYKVD